MLKNIFLILILFLRKTFVFIIIPLITYSGCRTGTVTVKEKEYLNASSSQSADDLFVVDCLLPGQIRKLGRMTYLTPRKPIKTAALYCEIRGGEYVAYDRSNYKTALSVWLSKAKEGDKVAQTYVGEIFEKGLGIEPDYVLAAQWYRKAADQGNERAQINLGYLYEKGLGVKKDPLTALNWYRKASGLKEAITLDPASINVKVQKELEELRKEVERRKRESESLKNQLKKTKEQLKNTREELEQRRNKVETELQKLENSREELARLKKKAEDKRDYAEIEKLKNQLKQREADLEHKSQEMNKLQQNIVRLEDETKDYKKQLKEIQMKQKLLALAGPTIEMIDPPIMPTRGLSIVKVPSKIEIERIIVGKVSAPAGLLTFTVNDREEKIEKNGLFSVPILVKSSGVPVKVVAIDKQGKRATINFRLTPKKEDVPPPPPPPPINFGNYYALIIGNENYNHWSTLATPEEDAKDTSEVLKKKYGFKTRVLLDATQYDVLKALNELRGELTENDNLLIYYAGHGYLEERIQRSYWIPVDGEKESDAKWIPAFRITDILSIMKARHVLVVADSCYSGALTRSAQARIGVGLTDEKRYERIKTMLQRRSRQVLTSGDIQPVLDIGGGEHSVFAKAFLDVLKENNEILEGYDLYKAVSARVVYETSGSPIKQEPQYAPLRFSGHESGDFFFKPITRL